MHTEKTLQNLRESLKDCEEIIAAQASYIRQLEHERDLLAAGYRNAMARCAQLEAAVSDPLLASRPTPLCH
jgi:hypothetical protein